MFVNVRSTILFHVSYNSKFTLAGWTKILAQLGAQSPKCPYLLVKKNILENGSLIGGHGVGVDRN